MNLHTNSLMHIELNFRFIPKLFILFILLFTHLHSTAQDDESAKKPKKNWPAVVHKITDLGLPQDMVYRIRRLNKAEMDSIHGEDYHENLKEGDKEYVLKVMLRFVDGRIIGFVKKVPMMQSNQGTYLSEVDIPVEWCGMDSLKTEHCVKSEEEMSMLDSGVVINPRDWHQKLDANEISTDVVSNNVGLLQLLENKSGRKKLQSSKMTDSLKHLLPSLTGADSEFVAKQLNLTTKEYQEAQRRKKGGDFIDDSTIAVITNGLTGADSLKAIKNYLVTTKASKSLKKDKKFQKGLSALDSTTLMSITKGLSGVDSINALKNYLEPPVVKVDKKNKSGEQMLDSATLASVTQGLTGSDSVNAIRSYVMAAKSKGGKKGKKGSSVVPIENTPDPIVNSGGDSSKAAQAVVVAPPPRPTKADKRKKRAEVEVAPVVTQDSSLAMATKGLSGADSINAIKSFKQDQQPAPVVTKKDRKKKKGNQPEQVVTDTTTATQSTPVISNKQDADAIKNSLPGVAKDSTSVSKPEVTPPIDRKHFRKRLKVEAPPTDDSSANKKVMPLSVDSTSNKMPAVDSTKPK